MRLYRGKIPFIATDIVRTLTADNDIEVSNEEEVRLDVEAVLKEYARLDRELLDKAKSLLSSRGLSYNMLGRMRSEVARETRLPTPDEALPYILDQMLKMLFHSQHVEEIYADDRAMRRKITTILRRHMDVEQELDREVRAKIKNLEEGTSAFDVEYAKVMERIKQRRGLDDT